ncbi:hypothetical protein FNF27_03060 [Cafeteria roenbergensis]|nr:hypothetical protein FNF29_05090 [Cafeteria roenbergensis]KAA0167216.1 hypothetical protein FNF31_01101 [Cafeteria roenbergensis]KAA0175357.1 hypothetical protein FNF27_03060 [Cafeteria roenbergensis]|eukprot:KAA0150755.1 hypothetical protein FNF29_05090 [Cafeteria roenbergensis]
MPSAGIPESYAMLKHLELQVSVGAGGPMPTLTPPDGRGLPVSADEALPDTSRFTALADDYAARIMSMEDS